MEDGVYKTVAFVDENGFFNTVLELTNAEDEFGQIVIG